jgi:hypothetical protein
MASAYLLVATLRHSARVVVTVLFTVGGLWLTYYLLAYTTVFSLGDVGNATKVGHAESFLEHLSPSTMLFGEGLASYYYSSGVNQTVAHTEVTPLDMARYFGLPLTVLLYVALLFPILKRGAYSGKARTAVVIFVIYLGISLTNPVLFNSYGLIVVLWYWSVILSESRGLSGALNHPATART